MRESLELLYKEPKMFIPRFITTALYTIVVIYMANVTSEILKYSGLSGDPDAMPDPQILMSFMQNLVPLMLFLMFVYLVDLFSYAMYPALVRDHYDKKPIQLISSMKEGLGAWKVLAVFVIIVTVVMGAVTMLFLQMLSRDLNTSSGIIAAFVLLGALVVILLLLFFVLPVAVVEKKGVRASFKQGMKLSLRYKKEVLQINIIFTLLMAITYTLMIVTDLKYSGILAFLSVFLFIAVRVFEAIIYTYISIVNPYFYMKVR